MTLFCRWLARTYCSNKKNGLVADFNGEVVTAKIPIYPQTEVASIDFTADLVILFTKAMQLEGMLEALEHFLNKNTKVLCLLNGIGHEDIIKNTCLTKIFY